MGSIWPASLTHLVNDGILVVSLDLHEHVCPAPVLVVVLQRWYGNQHVVEILQAHILTLAT